MNDEPHLHRVTLMSHAVFAIEVLAEDYAQAEAIARACSSEARLEYETTIEPMRVEILRVNDPKNPSGGIHWQELRPPMVAPGASYPLKSRPIGG